MKLVLFQIHLNVGLRKISETVEQVEDLRKELSRKNTELQYKNNLANEKLKQVVNDQQEAENKKKTSRQIRLVGCYVFKVFSISQMQVFTYYCLYGF